MEDTWNLLNLQRRTFACDDVHEVFHNNRLTRDSQSNIDGTLVSQSVPSVLMKKVRRIFYTNETALESNKKLLLPTLRSKFHILRAAFAHFFLFHTYTANRDCN